MEEKYLLALQTTLQDMASLHRDLAEKLMTTTHLISGLSSFPVITDESQWIFAPNDYGHLVDFAMKYKPKWQTESWPSYALRLTKHIGWDVDFRTLRRCFERKNGD